MYQPPPPPKGQPLDGTLGITLITRLCLGFSHLHEYKHRHNFPVSPICTYRTEPETTEHFLLHCQRFSQIRSDMLDNACELAKTHINLSSEELLIKFFLYGENTLTDISNQFISQGTISFIRLSE